MVQIKLLIQAENIYVGRMLLHSVLLLLEFLDDLVSSLFILGRYNLNLLIKVSGPCIVT